MPDRAPAAHEWPAGEGEMAGRVRAYAWAETAVGPIEAWPPTLRVVADLLLASRHPMLLWWGPELVQIYNDAYRETMGPEKHPGALGAGVRDTWAEIWDIIGPQIEQVMGGGPACWHEDQLVPVTRHGERRDVWWTYGFSPIKDAEAPGRVSGVLVICQDVTAAHLARDAAVESEEQQRLTLQLVPALLWRADPAGHSVSANARWRAHTGQRTDEVHDFGWLDAIHPDDIAATRAAFKHAFATGEPLERQQRVHLKGDGHRWHLVRHVPIRDEGGTITHWFGAAIDIHELRQLQDRQEVMVAELQHRTRNLLGVVDSIARQTLRASGSMEEFEVAFNARLGALSRVQGLLSRSDDTPITMRVLIDTELDALGVAGAAGRVEVRGPEVRLRKGMVQTFALALHELATNARKYGALSNDDGRLQVLWRTHADEAGRRLLLDWRETGLDRRREEQSPVSQPRGYGRQLIERALPYALGASTEYVLDDNGVRCVIDMPLERAMRRSRTR